VSTAEVHEPRATPRPLRTLTAGRDHLALAQLPVAVVVMDADGRITAWNDEASRLTGYAATERLGFSASFEPSTAAVVRAPSFQDALSTEGRWSGEFEITHRDGSCVPLSVTVVCLREDERVVGYVTMASDISDDRRSQSEFAYRALHDDLTSLPNRALFVDRARHALSRLTRNHGGMGVLFVDLDRFKMVNDVMGHGVGDSLLQIVAARVRQLLRPSDTIARLGGDEFVVLCNGLDHRFGAQDVAARIVEALSAPFVIDNEELFISASIGITVTTDPMADPEDLIREADTAMYRVKHRGGNGLEFFDAGMRADLRTRLEIERDLHHALQGDELELHHQPIIDLRTGYVAGTEALVRWAHPTLGLLEPDRFIATAEETGQIVDIGTWVLDAACCQMQKWEAAGHLPTRFSIAVNLSTRQLAQPGAVDLVADTLDRYGLPPRRLCIEITETAYHDDILHARSFLAQAQELGLLISIDDFGTGFSSLGRLRRFPVNALKIDRSFVSALTTDERDSRIVFAIIQMARELGLATVAEGVETVEQLQRISEHGCDFAQGFLFARPVRACELPSLLSRRFIEPDRLNADFPKRYDRAWSRRSSTPSRSAFVLPR
jgi:diguanylate cyclase (GGDEF)-like protein/PAS domain S-box-containing protein